MVFQCEIIRSTEGMSGAVPSVRLQDERCSRVRIVHLRYKTGRGAGRELLQRVGMPGVSSRDGGHHALELPVAAGCRQRTT